MIRHTDIIPGKAVGEGMLALRSYSGIKGKAHVGKQELLHFFLGIRIIVAFENTAVRLGRTEDFSGQGKKTFLQFLEDLVDGGAVHALLVKTQQSIVDVFSGIGVSELLLRILDHLLQMGSKNGKISRVFRLGPGSLGLVSGSSKTLVEVFRNLPVFFQVLFVFANRELIAGSQLFVFFRLV